MSVALIVSLVPWGLPMIPVHAAARSVPRVTFTIPASNVAFSDPVLDEHHVVYGVASTRFHRPGCVSCGNQSFTNFHVEVYVRGYQNRSGSIRVSQPRLLFAGPRGAQIGLYSLSAGWLVYATYELQDRWQLYARNVVTGCVILLDSPQMERLPSRFLHADSDGKTAVLQSWTRIRGRTTSVIRSYTLATGRRQLLVSDIRSNEFFGNPEIAGTHMVFVKETQTPQLFLQDLATHRVRALTPPGQSNFEPYISGDIVAWVHGDLTLGHTHGLVVASLSTGHRVALKRSSSQLPQIASGRYVVFGTDFPTAYPKRTVQVYDAVTRGRRTIASGPDSSGFIPSQTVVVGGNTVLFQMMKPCSASNGVCPTYFTLMAVAPNKARVAKTYWEDTDGAQSLSRHDQRDDKALPQPGPNLLECP